MDYFGRALHYEYRSLGIKSQVSSKTSGNQFSTIMEINYWTNGKICAKVAFPRYTESVKFRSQS